MAFNHEYEGYNGWTWGHSEYAAAQTDTELVAAPSAGAHIELAAWKFSSDAIVTVALQSGAANEVDKSYLAANSTVVFPFALDDLSRVVAAIRLDANTALTVTSVGTTPNHTVSVLYRVVNR